MVTAKARTLAAATALLVLLAQALPVEAAGHSRQPRKSPHVEIVAVARVSSHPKKTRHSNGRHFEEFHVVILSARIGPDQPRDADSGLSIARDRPVHVVHDLSCGGKWLDLAVGDEVEIQGEYVAPPDGKDLIHFTHPSGGSCGSAESHPGGYLRKRARAA